MASINTNMASIYAQANLSRTQNAVQGSLNKLSSGYRINKASDDAAGLAISEKMRGQIRGLKQAQRNAQDGISLLQTAEGALNETHSILQRIRELADQSANGTNTADDRAAIQDEVVQLKKEIDRIGNDTEFNTQKLLNGALGGPAGTSVGSNVTTGAVVGKQIAGTKAGVIETTAALTFAMETFKIDGVDIDVHWENLTSDEKAILQNAETTVLSQNNAAKLIETKINEAIDASGYNIAHVKAYMTEGATAGVADNVLNIASGSVGTNSEIQSAGLIHTITTNGAQTAGASTYNGAAVGVGAIYDLKVNNVLMKVTTSAPGSTSMVDYATALQTDMNAAITAMNGSMGRVDGQEGFLKAVTVVATNDGRFQITSESGPVEFADIPGGSTVSNLGLSTAQSSGANGGGVVFQVGANKGQTISFSLNDMRTAALGIAGVDVSTQGGASNALTQLDSAIKAVSSERSKLGAMQNRLEHSITNLATSADNLTVAESNIRDVDMAAEMSTFTKNNILAQAGASMLAQANQAPQMILKLLG